MLNVTNLQCYLTLQSGWRALASGQDLLMWMKQLLNSETQTCPATRMALSLGLGFLVNKVLNDLLLVDWLVSASSSDMSEMFGNSSSSKSLDVLHKAWNFNNIFLHIFPIHVEAGQVGLIFSYKICDISV